MRAHLTGLALLAALSAADVAAQRTDTHKGATMAFAVGRGTLRLNCDGCGLGREADISAMLRFGWTVSEHLFVAAELMGFEHSRYVDLQTLSVRSVWAGGVALWYPRRFSDAYFKVGAGFSGNKGPFAITGSGDVDITFNRPSLLAGVGADLRIGRTFSLTPFADFVLLMPADHTIPGRTEPVRLSGNVVNFGLALTQH